MLFFLFVLFCVWPDVLSEPDRVISKDVDQNAFWQLTCQETFSWPTPKSPASAASKLSAVRQSGALLQTLVDNFWVCVCAQSKHVFNAHTNRDLCENELSSSRTSLAWFTFQTSSCASVIKARQILQFFWFFFFSFSNFVAKIFEEKFFYSSNLTHLSQSKTLCVCEELFKNRLDASC